MLFLLSILLFVAIDIPIISIFSLKKIASTLLASYLIVYGLITLNAEISGFLGLLNHEWFFLLLQFSEAGIAWILWWKKGKPSLLGNFNHVTVRSLFSKTITFIKKAPFESLFLVFVVAGYGVLAWTILNVPPNNSDSMHTHLARVIYWLQQGSFKQLATHSIFARIYPFDAQLNLLWTVLFTHSDRYVGFVQFFAALSTAIAIYGIGRLLNSSRRNSLIVAILWLTFPLVVFEATSTQFDLAVTSLFVLSVFFFYEYYLERNKHTLFLSGLSMGLALGTKETVFMMGPAVAIVGVLILIKDKRNYSWMLQWVITVLVSFLLLGSYTYFNNLHYYGNPLGPSEHVSQDSTGGYSLGEKVRYNTPRLIYQFTSLDSLPVQLANNLNEIKIKVFTFLDKELTLEMESTKALKTPDLGLSLQSSPKYNEDEAWFGIASVLLLVPAFFLGLIRGIKKKDILSLSLCLFVLSFYFFEIWLRPGWDRYQGRYFNLAVAILVPLAALLFTRNIFSKIYKYIVILLAMVTFFMAVFSNESKPLLASTSFEKSYTWIENNYIPTNALESNYRKYALIVNYKMWENMPFSKSINDYSDIQLRTLSSRNLHEVIVEDVNRLVPEDATMGVSLVNGTFDYVFFGPKLRRILINLEPIDSLYDFNWIKEKGISYILLSDFQRFKYIPPYLNLISSVDNWRLYEVIP